ncbi:MAG: glycosyltransferase [Candidatus Aenigmatarchaeota archaeon]
MTNTPISIIIPVYNEEKVLEKNSEKIIEYMERRHKRYEIILCDNGSTDSTYEKGKNLSKKFKRIKFIQIGKRGVGLALKEMIRKSKFENIIFLPIDMSFDLKFIKDALPLLKKYDLVIGSKSFKKSIVRRPITRKIFSLFFNSLVNIFFGLGISDTQSVKAFRKSKIKKLSEEIESEDLFFDVELLIKSKKAGLKIIEIPVICNDMRKTHYNILIDSARAFFKLLDFWFKTKFMQY